jgi:membrane protease YdiL (CAAX protease family)
MTGRLTLTLFGLLLTIGCGSLPFPVWDHELADTAHLVGNELIYWALVAATLLYVSLVERRPLSSIGLRKPSLRDITSAIGTAVVLIVLLAMVYFWVFPLFHIQEDAQINKLLATPGWWLAISVVRAGVSEEVLFRGYPIERLSELTGSRWAAALLPLVPFMLAHVAPWGWAHLLVAGIGGGILTGLYLWRRNLWANILAHCLIDGVAVIS